MTMTTMGGVAYILLTLTRILRLNQGLADTALTRCLHGFLWGTLMYARLTRTFVETQVCPARGQIIIRDTDIKGLGLRLTPNCKSFIVERRVNGTQHRVTLGQFPSISVEVARKEAQRILTDMAAGIDPTIPPLKPPTLAEVLDRYLAERPMKPETKRTYRSLVERLLPDWLKLPITSISREMILTRHQGLLRTTRCGTENKSCANSTMQVLRTLINFAACKYGLEPDNPTDALKYRWYRQEARQGTIPDGKLPDFYRAVMRQESKIARDFILLLLFSGLRRGEAARLKWADINLDARTLTIAAAHNKSNRVHVLPLTEMLVAILQSRLPAESEYVFPGRYDGHISEPRAPLAKLRQQMGWQWLLHDLRRTALSAGEKAGVPFLALQKIANHVVTREVTDRYLVLDVEFIRLHMETISTRLLELMETSVEEWRVADQEGLPTAADLEPEINADQMPEPIPEISPPRRIAWVLMDEEEDEPEILEGVCW
jgi:integrase